ncbi:MAG TPA: ArpU family transcriptional regulator [Lactobacillus acetotolerans]|jgi:ArpU family phage transcriptional regulator|nr:ArpU family transcriptional regulator [Lactobacillus acetotolerans]
MELIKLNLFTEIDVQATTDNVDNFLKNKIPHLLLRCGRGLTDLSSPQLSLAPAHSNGLNHQEDSIINALGIEPVVEAVHHTIYNCSSISQIILLDIYIHNYSVERTLMDLPYERSQYFHKLKPKALLEFADRYDYWQRASGVDVPNIIDLHIPIKQKTYL